MRADHRPVGSITTGRHRQEHTMNTEADMQREQIRQRYAEAATAAAGGQQAIDGPDGTNFGTSLYDESDRRVTPTGST